MKNYNTYLDKNNHNKNLILMGDLQQVCERFNLDLKTLQTKQDDETFTIKIQGYKKEAKK